MAEAVSAYIKCQELSPDDRQRLIDGARVKTTVRQAVKLVFTFAHGYLKEPWSPKMIQALTRAWLRLGETLFCWVYRWVRPKNSKPQGDFQELLRITLPKVKLV